jgi:hypothetical protein
MTRRPTDLEVARAIHYNESLRTQEPRELEHDEVLRLFTDEPAEIVVTEDMYAPRSDYYVATFGDFDLDCLTGRGHTPLDAIVDLLDKAEG